MNSDKITIMTEKFNTSEGNQVDGLTLMLDGTIKSAFDKISSEQNYEDNTNYFGMLY